VGILLSSDWLITLFPSGLGDPDPSIFLQPPGHTYYLAVPSLLHPPSFRLLDLLPLIIVWPQLMALKANASPFVPGTGSQPSSASNSKAPSFSNSPSPSPTSSSGPVANQSNNKAPPRSGSRNNFPRTSQGKRGQTQRKAERKGRLTDDVLTADPSIESVCHT
jgi:hypothetical protein